MDKQVIQEWANRELQRYAKKVPVLKPLYKIPMPGGGFMMSTEQPKEASERDTHFQGFAKLSYPDLKHWFKELFDANLERNTRRAEQAENMIKLTLTRRAYDLLYSICIDRSNTIGVTFFGTPAEVHEAISTLPDLTTWPES